MLFYFVLLAVARADEMPPEPRLARSIGCDVQQIDARGDAFEGWWRLYVWADYGAGERWRRLYSVRAKRWRAFRDCDRWLDRVRAVERGGRR